MTLGCPFHFIIPSTTIFQHWFQEYTH